MASLLRIALFAMVLLALACAAETGPSKGEEDNPLTDGKADSFRRPTEHGKLVFGRDRNARITDEAMFHAWDFALEGQAEVALRTQVSDNLDTVMYLYQRDEGDEHWGRYLDKNDDYDGTLGSRIALPDAPPGEYRVIVKGFKKQLRGPFTLQSKCEGEGCPSESMCEPGRVESLPSESFTAACGQRFVEVVGSPVTSRRSVAVSEEDVCTLGGIEQHAVALYKGYWDEVLGWDAFVDGFTDGPSFEVETARHERGTHVVVDVGMDEDAITFVFDADDRPLFLYQDNQSPDERWLCGASDDAHPPSCGREALQALVHSAEAAESGSGTTTPNEADSDVPIIFFHSIGEFALGVGIEADEEVEYEYVSWEADTGLVGGRIKLSAGGVTETLWVGTTFYEHEKIFVRQEEEGSTRFACLELT